MQTIGNDLQIDFMMDTNGFMNHMLLNSDKCHYIVIGDNGPSH